MIDDLRRKIRQNIQRDMQEKFGLSDSQTEQSSRILSERLMSLLNEARQLENLSQIKAFLLDLTGETNDRMVKFKNDTIRELMDKAELSQATAARLQAVSMEKYRKQFESAFHEIQEKWDLNEWKENVEDNAREVMIQLTQWLKIP